MSSYIFKYKSNLIGVGFFSLFLFNSYFKKSGIPAKLLIFDKSPSIIFDINILLFTNKRLYSKTKLVKIT